MTTTIEDIGFAAVNWHRLEQEWQRRSAANEPASRDAVGQALAKFVEMLHAYTAQTTPKVPSVNEEDGA